MQALSASMRVVGPLGRTCNTSFAARARPGVLAMSRPRSTAAMATKTIKKDDKLPSEVELCYFDGNDMKKKTVGELTKNKKVVLVGVPGAFTPTCSLQHVPGFIAKAEELKSRGVDLIGCVSVNDAFVMRAWGKDLAATDKVAMLADGSGDFTRAAGLELDLSDKGLGVRCRRFALLAEDGVVKVLHLEKGGDFDVSSAEDLLKAL